MLGVYEEHIFSDAKSSIFKYIIFICNSKCPISYCINLGKCLISTQNVLIPFYNFQSK